MAVTKLSRVTVQPLAKVQQLLKPSLISSFLGTGAKTVPPPEGRDQAHQPRNFVVKASIVGSNNSTRNVVSNVFSFQFYLHTHCLLQLTRGSKMRFEDSINILNNKIPISQNIYPPIINFLRRNYIIKIKFLQVKIQKNQNKKCIFSNVNPGQSLLEQFSFKILCRN